MGKCERILSAS